MGSTGRRKHTNAASAAGRRLSGSLRAMRVVVARPDLRRAELAYAWACTGEWACTVGLGVVAYEDGGATTVALVALARMGPAAVALPFVATLADRMRRDRLLVLASMVRAASLAVIALLLATRGPGLGVYVLAAVATMAFTVFRPVHSALLPLLCETTRDLTSANVARGVVDSAAALLGPVLAGVLLGLADATSVFVAAVALSAASAGALVRIRGDAVRQTTRRGRGALAGEVLDGLRAVIGHRDLAVIFGLGFAQTVVRGALNVLLVVVSFGPLGTGDGGVAALVAAIGAGGLIGSLGVSLLVGSRRLGGWLAVALVLWGAPIAFLALDVSPLAACTLLAVVGLGNALIDVPLFTLPVRLADDALLARVFGVFESLVALGVGLGSLATPALVRAVGLSSALIAVGLLLPLLAVVALHRLRRLDEELGARDAEIDVLRQAPMLGVLPVPTIEHLAARVVHRTFPAGAVVFAQGEPGASFAVIVEGRAEVLGDGARVALLGPGASFGEIALVHDVGRTATVRAHEALHVLELDRDAFLGAVGGSVAGRDATGLTVAGHLANFRPAGVVI